MVHLVTPSRVTPHRGCPSAAGLGQRPCTPCGTLDSGTMPPPSRGGHRDLRGHGPQNRDQRTGHRHHNWMRGVPPCPQWSLALAQAARCLPPRVLERRGELVQAAWQVPPPVRRIASGPSPVDEGPTGRGIPGLRAASLVSALPTRLCRRRQAPRLQEWAGGLDAGQGAECGDGGDRPWTRHATEGVERVHHRAKPPGCDRFMACLVKTLEPVGGRGDRAALCVEDDGLGWGGQTTARRQRR